MYSAATSKVFQHVLRASNDESLCLALPFSMDAVLADLQTLRHALLRRPPEAFSRQELAYLVQFLEPSGLRSAIELGMSATFAQIVLSRRFVVARPRGSVAVWLPSNVSLLGPLTFVLLLLSGNRLLLKASSGGTDLTGELLDFIERQLPENSSLRVHIRENVAYGRFDRSDARSAEWAAGADFRVLFGGDEAAASVDSFPHPIESGSAYFVDRRSEAWIDPSCASDAVLRNLLRVFAVYGQAGCTSPGRVVVLNGSESEVRDIRDRAVELWRSAIGPRDLSTPRSATILAWQWYVANDIDAALTPDNVAVLVLADSNSTAPQSVNSTVLPFMALPVEAAIRSLPPNIQTIGVALPDDSERWLIELASRTRVRRIVPLEAMHHFGTIWDGRRFFSELFTYIPIG